MKLIHQSHEILNIDADPLKLIEIAGRTCYKSEDKICEGSDVKFTAMLLGRHHESVIEHSLLTVRFITNRGVTHELVRHRLCSFSQESTRYVTYESGCTYIIPVWCEDLVPQEYTERAMQLVPGDTIASRAFMSSLAQSEIDYRTLLHWGWKPQQAREVLPNALKTEIVMSGNFRNWRHVLTERTSKAAHPQMRALMIPLLAELKSKVPVIFDDILP